MARSESEFRLRLAGARLFSPAVFHDSHETVAEVDSNSSRTAARADLHDAVSGPRPAAAPAESKKRANYKLPLLRLSPNGPAAQAAALYQVAGKLLVEQNKQQEFLDPVMRNLIMPVVLEEQKKAATLEIFQQITSENFWNENITEPTNPYENFNALNKVVDGSNFTHGDTRSDTHDDSDTHHDSDAHHDSDTHHDSDAQGSETGAINTQGSETGKKLDIFPTTLHVVESLLQYHGNIEGFFGGNYGLELTPSQSRRRILKQIRNSEKWRKWNNSSSFNWNHSAYSQPSSVIANSVMANSDASGFDYVGRGGHRVHDLSRKSKSRGAWMAWKLGPEELGKEEKKRGTKILESDKKRREDSKGEDSKGEDSKNVWLILQWNRWDENTGRAELQIRSTTLQERHSNFIYNEQYRFAEDLVMLAEEIQRTMDYS